MFNKIQTYLLRRIFEDLDPSLFQTIEGPILPSPTSASSLSPSTGQDSQETILLHNSIEINDTTSPRRFKNQIIVYNQIINLINHYKSQLTDDNYKLIVLYFEYYYLNIKLNRVIDDNPRRQVLNYIDYILSSIDDTVLYTTTIEIDKILHTFNQTCNLPQLDDVLSDFNYFIKQFQSNITKTTLIHAVSLTFAYEVFQYPTMANKINNNKSTNLKQRRLLIQFSRFYFITAWLNYTQNKSLKFIALDEVAQQFCQTEFDKVVKDIRQRERVVEGILGGRGHEDQYSDEGGGGCGSIDDRLIQMYNAGSLAELRSDEIIQLFQEAMKEYRFRRQLTNKNQ